MLNKKKHPHLRGTINKSLSCTNNIQPLDYNIYNDVIMVIDFQQVKRMHYLPLDLL